MMDIRHPMTDFDRLMLDWAMASGMPMHILLTKADKLTFGAAKNALLKVQSEIHRGWGDATTIQLFSAPKRMGLEEAYTVLADWMGLGDKARPPTARCLNRRQKKPGLHVGGGKFGVQVQTSREG